MSTPPEATIDAPLILSRQENNVAWLTLNRPARHNALTPTLLDALSEAIEALPGDLTALVLCGAGPTFSSGGDVGEFAVRIGEGLESYARDTVGALNRVILKLLSLPFPVIAVVQGFVSGGSCGLVFASDFTIMADDAYIAPYYVDVGLAPDGGWTALLPKQIGRARALRIQLLNSRLSAHEALDLGLVSHVAKPDAMNEATGSILAALLDKSPQSLRATKRLLFPDDQMTRLETALDAELATFVSTILTAEAAIYMRRFLTRGSRDKLT